MALRDIRSNRDESCPWCTARKPTYLREWLGKDVLGHVVIDLADNPFLELTACTIEPASGARAVGLVKYHSAASATAPNNGQHRKSAERKSAARPRKCRELQQNPISFPAFAFVPQLAAGLPTSLCAPSQRKRVSFPRPGARVHEPKTRNNPGCRQQVIHRDPKERSSYCSAHSPKLFPFHSSKVHSVSFSSNLRHTRPYTTRHANPVRSSGHDFIYEIVFKSERSDSETRRHREQMKSAINLNCTIQISLGGDART